MQKNDWIIFNGSREHENLRASPTLRKLCFKRIIKFDIHLSPKLQNDVVSHFHQYRNHFYGSMSFPNTHNPNFSPNTTLFIRKDRNPHTLSKERKMKRKWKQNDLEPWNLPPLASFSHWNHKKSSPYLFLFLSKNFSWA